jgi:hypothetical protein
MRFSVIFLLFVSSVSVTFGEEIDAKSVRVAITKAIPWLEKDMVAWRESNGCAACHHGPMYVWSMHVAKRQGYAVNERQLQDYTEWMVNNELARIFPKATSARLTESSSAADRMTAAMMGHKNLSQPTLYLGHALNALPQSDPLAAAGWRKLQQHWSAAQLDDGSFAGRKGWPPIFSSPQILTLFANTALADRLKLKTGDTELIEALQRLDNDTTKFLRGQTPDASHQGLVLRLLRQSQHGGDTHALVDELIGMQRGDGGWSQTRDRDSDAFATGQSLYVLHWAGVSPRDTTILKGLNFLAKSQSGDGTWPMTSRANPETGKPADDLNPITYAATAWATIGMSSNMQNER